MSKKNNRYIIGIGAQKAGTSWLTYYLSRHPQVLVSPVKEVHFFDSVYRADLCPNMEQRMARLLIEVAHKLQLDDILENKPRFKRFTKLNERLQFNGDIQRYRDYFTENSKNKSIFCDVTPEYALLDTTGFEAVKSLADDVRLVFILRNPIDRFWSEMRMRSKKKPDSDIFAKTRSLLDKTTDHPSILCTEYHKTLETLYQVFPKERVFVQFYEHLFNSESIAQLCQFCDIDFVEPNIEKRVMQGISIPLTDELRATMYHKFSQVYDWAEHEFGTDLPEVWRKDMAKFR
ncbi:MAG: sulfotransferase domain-containing protein [Methylococcaceae bacterium]